jgi:hypothetical protein
MDLKRRQTELEKLRLQIIRHEKSQERDQHILKNIPRLNIGSDLSLQKTNETKERIDFRNKEISILQQRSKEISEGKLDSELSEQYKEESTLYHKKRDTAIKRKQEIIQDEHDRKQIMYNKPRDKENKHIEKDYSYFLKLHNKIGDSLPDYIISNLQNMPNNKGYIWKGCLFLGYLPPERGQPMVSFEKLRGGITRIYETDSYETRIYEKKGRDRKILISQKPRNNFKLSSNAFSL